MAPRRPILDDLELQQVQEIETDGERVRARHEVPALEGDFLQDLGRRGTRIDLSGVLTGPESGEGLAQLREKFRAAEPVPFVSDIATATRVEDVVIEDLAVRELAGRPERFAYDITLREYTEPPATTTEEPPEIEPPVVPPADLGILVIEVIVEGEPEFDMNRVAVTALGPAGPGAVLRTVTERTENHWTARDLAPGSYTAEARVAGEDMRGSASGEVRAGETAQVTINLRPAARTAPTFLIHFHFDSAFIEPCMRHVLRQVAEHAGAHAAENLLIVGHTDRAGPPDYNQSLSERRARSAHAFLTFGRDAAGAVAEWNELRKPRPAGVIRTVNDTWGTREYQHMLQDLGLYPGEIHGQHDALTGEAVEAFRAAHGLPAGTTVDDVVWPELVRAYMAQDNLAVPEDRFLPNCPGEVLKWLGCSEHDPVKNILTAWRPNRRTELLFVTADALPCPVPRPDTFDKPTPGVVGSDWCVGGPGASARCCFVTPADKPCPPEEEERFCRESAEGRDRFTVRGSIRRQDGTPMANHHYRLIAPDGEFMDGEVKESGNGVRAGTGNKGRTQGDGTFEYPAKPKGKGVYTMEVDGPFVARLAGEPLTAETAKGPVVCKRLDGSSGFDVIVVGVDAVRVRPSLALASSIVVVKKPHTTPARRSVTLSASEPFNGNGTLTRPDDRIRFFKADGTEVTFNGTDNVFTSAELVAGVTLFAEGARPSAALADFDLVLTLVVNGAAGLSAVEAMTSVELTLDVAERRAAPAAEPPAMSAQDKVNPGRFLQLQDPSLQAERAMLIVRPPTPAGLTGNLALRPLSAGVRGFAVEAPAAGQAPLADPHVFPVASVPAAGLRLFAEGVAVSGADRDTGFQLGIDGLEPDGDRTVITVFALELIAQANGAFPTVGDDACLMVSKFVTNVNFPDNATFAGPPGANPDPDTFRVQLRGLPGGLAPQTRLETFRGAARRFNHTFGMIEGVVGARPTYRMNEHSRLVSNAVDDAHRAHQTPLVRLADVVRATPVLGGRELGRLQLPVGRPPAEDGPKAIRTVDVHFVTLRGVPSDPAAIVERLSEDWAQLAIRFNLASEEIVDPVTNVLTIDGTANADGQLRVRITPQGGAATDVVAQIRNGDTDQQMAQNLAAAISARPGLAATHHRHQDLFIVLVNRRQEVAFANVTSTVASVVFQEPALSFINAIDLLEGSVLGLNFADANLSNIDMIAVHRASVLGVDGATGGDFLAANLPGWHNVAIVREEAADADDTTMPFIAGHEVGHALFDGGNAQHSPLADTTNLFRAIVSAADTLGATKRLNDPQNTRARLVSGPATVPPLLLKR